MCVCAHLDSYIKVIDIAVKIHEANIRIPNVKCVEIKYNFTGKWAMRRIAAAAAAGDGGDAV